MSSSPRRLLLISLAVVAAGAITLVGLALWWLRGPTPPTKAHRLPSGRVVDVFYADRVEDQWHLLYRTRLRLSREVMLAHMAAFDPRRPQAVPAHLHSQLRELQCEAETLRDDVQREAQVAGVRQATIGPTSTARERIEGWPLWRGGISVSRSLEFGLRQNGKGLWEKAAGWMPERCGP
jgi:hypothetical protein